MTRTLLLSAEHATNFVPPAYRAVFAGKQATLASHRGWDPGTLELARGFAAATGAPLVQATVSRLLVELNRSIGHVRLFSEFAKQLPIEARKQLLADYYVPYRAEVEQVIAATQKNETVVHLSVHSFTPVLDGVTRKADVALLYDPARRNEREFADEWFARLRERRRDLKLRRNYPYQGKSDGLTTSLRKKFGPRRYLGIELEVNQKFPLGKASRWRELQESLTSSLAELF